MTPSFTCKVRIREKTVQGNYSLVVMEANYGLHTEIHREWALATPWLEFKQNIRNELADQLQPGQTYTVLFTPDDMGEQEPQEPQPEGQS